MLTAPTRSTENNLSSVYAPSTRLRLHVKIISITDRNDNESTHKFPFVLFSRLLLNLAGLFPLARINSFAGETGLV